MKYQYCKVLVEHGDILDIPAGSKGIQIRPLAKKNTSFVEWLQPEKEDC